MKNTSGLNKVCGLVLIASLLTACGGNCPPPNQTTNDTNPTLNGLAYDAQINAVFSVSQSGTLCKLLVKNIPGNMSCNIIAPDNIIISSQVVSDNQGNIYALGSQASTTDNFILQYNTQSGIWTTNKIDLPFVLSFSKLLYRNNKLYIADPNLPTLYTINLSSKQFESSSEMFNPGPAVIEDFDQNGNLYYSYQTNNESNFNIVSQTTVYITPIGAKSNSAQFGTGNVFINDLVYVKNTAYACAESNFLYLPAGSNGTDNWQVLTNSSQSGYFSCDYLTTDNNNLYYVEGQWNNEEIFHNNFVNKIKIN